MHSSLVQCIVWYLANILFICLTKLQVLSNIIYLSFYFLLSLHLYWSLWHLSMKKYNKIDNMILSYCQTAEAVSRLSPFLTGPVRCACPSLANCQGRTWRQLLCPAFVPLSRRNMGQRIAATSPLHSCWWQTNALRRGAWRTQQYIFLFYIHFIWMVFTQSIFEITFASIIYCWVFREIFDIGTHVYTCTFFRQNMFCLYNVYLYNITGNTSIQYTMINVI